MDLPEKNGNVVKYTWLTNILVVFIGALLLTVWTNLSSQVHDMQNDIRTLQVQVAALNAHMDDLLSQPVVATAPPQEMKHAPR